MTTTIQPEFTDKYRQMVDILENSTPDESYEFVKENPDSDLRGFHEIVISKDAESSLCYAEEVIKGPWEPGEDAISKDAEWSYWYACDVIEGRWEKGEDTISKDACYSWMYAYSIIGGRWKKGESAISEDAYAMWRYAEKVIKGPLPDQMHNKLAMLSSLGEFDDEWVKKYCQKYMV